MKPYADTNFFTAAVLPLAHSKKSLHLLENHRRLELPPLPVTWLLRFEFLNALQRMIYEAHHGAQALRATPEMMLLAEDEFYTAMKADGLWIPAGIPAFEMEARFDALARRYTAKEGFRTYDILHVASAQALGCDTLWSFDRHALRLAKLEGMKTS